MNRFSAILFDLDGTLVNTVSLMEQAYMRAFRLFGVAMSLPEFRALYERNARTVDYLRKFGVNAEFLEAFRKVRDAAYLRAVAENVNWLNGGKPLLEGLRGRLPLGIATGAQSKYVEAIDRRLNVRAFIPTIICADEPGYRRKPDPFSLLKAAECLGVDPEAALYVGDQPTDVAAAKLARMTSCLITGTGNVASVQAKPDFQIGSLHELATEILALHTNA